MKLVTIISGLQGTGKTTLANKILADNQFALFPTVGNDIVGVKYGHVCEFFDDVNMENIFELCNKAVNNGYYIIVCTQCIDAFFLVELVNSFNSIELIHTVI